MKDLASDLTEYLDILFLKPDVLKIFGINRIKTVQTKEKISI